MGLLINSTFLNPTQDSNYATYLGQPIGQVALDVKN